MTSHKRKRRGLAPAAPPRGSMTNREFYFNWWGQGADHRPPINTEWVNDLLRNTLEFDEDMLSDMGGTIQSEIFGAALIMMESLMLVDMPDWMPIQYRNPLHNFESGMNHLRYMAPALVAALGSDPENTIRIRCQSNGIPASLRKEGTTSLRAEQLPRRREPDLRTKLKEKSEGPSTSAILAEPCNQDVQEVTEDNNNTLSKSTPLPAGDPFQ
jgi:hypothetical protein